MSPAEAEEIARRILTLLSYALRVEPRLIRAVRRLLVKGRLGAGLEARVWQDDAFQSRHHRAAEFRADAARQLREDFEREGPDVRRDVFELIRRCHLGPYPDVWRLERLGLEAEAAKVGLGDDDLAEAIRWVSRQRDILREDGEKQDPLSDESLFFRRAFVRLPETALEGSAADALHESGR